jgi:DNA polymerase III epsilon subunit-like protein
MKLLIFDTETTGLPKLRESANVSPNNWPHLVSISWVILDSVTNQIEKKENFIVYPEKWVIPEEASNIHGITQEKALKEGEPLESIMMCFLYDQYDILVAHNLEFDLNISRNCFTTASKIELANEFSNIKTLCDINACSVIASLTWSNIEDLLYNYELSSNKTIFPIFCISLIFKTPTAGCRETIVKMNYKIN